MAREDRQRIDRLPQVDPVSNPQAIRVVARPVSQFVAPAQDDLLSQVVGGLSQLNPALAQYVQQKNTSDALAAVERAEQIAAQQNPLDPASALSSAEAMPEDIDPAFRTNFDKAYRRSIGLRHAEKIQADMLAAWDKVRMSEETDPEQWLRQFVQENTAGFDDPIMLEAINKGIMGAAKVIRTDARNLAFKRLEQTTRESVAGSFAMITGDMTPEEMLGLFRDVISPSAKSTGFFTQTELNKMLVDRINTLSIAGGGRPELFDALLESRDPSTGKTIAEMNPQLAEMIVTQRRAAENAMNTERVKALQSLHYEKALAFENRAMAGDPPTMEELHSEIGQFGMYQTWEQASAAYIRYQRLADGAKAQQYHLELARTGRLGSLPEADQRKTMDLITAPIVGQLFEASQLDDGGRQFNRLVGQLVQAHRDSGASVPNSQLQNLYGTLMQVVPKPGDVPDQRFKTLAQLYAQLPPHLQATYVKDEDARLVLSRYNEARSGGPGTQLDEASAYAGAWAAKLPEAKAAADRWLKSPEGHARVREIIDNKLAVVGWRAVLGFEKLGTYPTNEDVVTDRAMLAVRGFIERNGGNVSDKEIETFASQWFTERYVYDRNSNTYVEVPAGQAGETTAEAISNYTAKVQEEWGEDVGMRVTHMGNGRYQIRGVGAAGNIIVHQASLQDMLDDYYATKNLDPREQEGSRLMALQRALMDGTATPEMLAAEDALITKARALGIWREDMLKRVDDVRKKGFQDAMSPILRDAPAGSLEGVDNSKLPSKDNLKGDLAGLYWEQGHMGKALTVLGEGVVLKAYPDPATGTNIGVAYNMDANKKTLAEDFRRAGIPAEHIQGIKEGKIAITQMQAMRLFDVAYDRAEKQTESFISKLYGKDAWKRMPRNRKAVLVDVMYQLGPGNFEKFKPTLERFMSETGSTADQNFTVHYRKGGKGELIPDRHRNNLRLNALNGEAAFLTVIERVKGIPRDKLQAQAQLQPTN